MTMPHPAPEWRTATAAELVGHDARIGRARADRQLPCTLHALCEQAARLVHCGHCWARPGHPCTVPIAPGYHLERFQRAERRGLITRAELAAVVEDLDVIAPGAVVYEGGPVGARVAAWEAAKRDGQHPDSRALALTVIECGTRAAAVLLLGGGR